MGVWGWVVGLLVLCAVCDCAHLSYSEDFARFESKCRRVDENTFRWTYFNLVVANGVEFIIFPICVRDATDSRLTGHLSGSTDVVIGNENALGIRHLLTQSDQAADYQYHYGLLYARVRRPSNLETFTIDLKITSNTAAYITTLCKARTNWFVKMDEEVYLHTSTTNISAPMRC